MTAARRHIQELELRIVNAENSTNFYVSLINSENMFVVKKCFYLE